MQPDEPGTDLPPGFAAATGWQVTLLLGVITFVLGLIVTLRPSGSLNVIAVLLGLLMIVSGLFHLFRVFGGGESHRVWQGIAGLLLVVIGVVLIRHLHLTVALVGLIIGLSWIVEGVAALISAFAGGSREGRGLVDLLRDPHPDRRDRDHGVAGGVGHGHRRPDRDLVHHLGPVRDRRRHHAPERGKQVTRHRGSIRHRFPVRQPTRQHHRLAGHPLRAIWELARGHGSPGAGGYTQAQRR